MPPKEKYSDPKLRDEVKEEIHQSDKGGKPGQWSARKAQLMASEYKKRGGGYNQSKEEGQDESQKHLDDWTKEEWQTKEGSGNAKKSDGSRQRYLPKKAWEKLSDDEKEKTDQKKVNESKKGKQFVGNTGGAKKAGRKARKSVEEGEEKEDGEDNEEEDQEENEEEQGEVGGEEEEEEEEEEEPKEASDTAKGNGKGKQKVGTKRSAQQANGSNKKREVKKAGSKNTEDQEAEEDDDDDENYSDEELEEDEEGDEEEEQK